MRNGPRRSKCDGDHRVTKDTRRIHEDAMNDNDYELSGDMGDDPFVEIRATEACSDEGFPTLRALRVLWEAQQAALRILNENTDPKAAA